MKMYILLLAVIVCTGLARSQEEVPCYGEGCSNITVYLGPKWGSRVVMIPRAKTTVSPVSGRYRPQHRPVPEEGRFQVDFGDEEVPSEVLRPWGTPKVERHTKNYYQTTWWARSTTRNPTESSNSNKRVKEVLDGSRRDTLNLSWRGYTGQDLKGVFNSSSASNATRIGSLNLENNRISQLPLFTFPTKFEFDLLELSLAHNPITPSLLDGITRFEISRLLNLRILNVSHCGLTYYNEPGLKRLEVLDLSHNRLRSIPFGLYHLETLIHLFLQDNQITYIASDQLFSINNYLQILDLSNNSLKEIEGEPLKNLWALKTVKLDNNNLTTLPLLNPDFSHITKIVSVANNSLQCSCHLMDLLNNQNVQIRFDDFESCRDGDRNISLFMLKMYPEDHGYMCQDEWTTRAKKVLEQWYQNVFWDINFIQLTFQIVGMVVVAVSLLKVLRLVSRRGKSEGAKKACNIPYNMLDEQQVSTVCGPHVDV